MHEDGVLYGLPSLTGAKDHDPSSKYSKGPSFSLRPRGKIYIHDSGPGPDIQPGDHVYRTGKEDVRTALITGKPDDARLNSYPGPGHYNTENAFSKTAQSKPAFSFGKKAKEGRNFGIPGPGSYDVATKGNVKGFSLGRIIHYRKASTSPSPADYNPSGGSRKVYRQGPEGNKGFTIYGRIDRLLGDGNPGPGSYEHTKALEKTKERICVPNFGGNAKGPQPNNNPGPGAYDPSWENNIKTFRIHEKVNLPNCSETPGPAHYSIDGKLYNTGKHTGRVVSIKGKAREQLDNGVPGPGTYSPVVQRKSNISYSIYERRDTNYADGLPGPGSYKLPSNEPTTRRYIMAGKPKELKEKDFPGPLDYHIADDITNHGKLGGNRFSLGGKVQWRPDDGPGPGSYSPRGKDKAEGPEWSFGDKISLGYGTDIPGPGYYHPNDDHRVKTIKMTEDKGKTDHFNTPGPNYYKIDPDISDIIGRRTVAFSMKGRPEHVDSTNIPGPTSYVKPFNKDEYHGEAFTFGEKFDAILDSNPGPGQYESDPMLGRTIRSDKPSCPQYTFGARSRES